MRLNSPEQLKTGRRLIEEFGSWSAVQENSAITPDGVYVVGLNHEAVEKALKKLDAATKTPSQEGLQGFVSRFFRSGSH